MVCQMDLKVELILYNAEDLSASRQENGVSQGVTRDCTYGLSAILERLGGLSGASSLTAADTKDASSLSSRGC